LDKYRQLATKFLEIEELSNFKFQKDFLKPFLFIFENNPDQKIKDMVLSCINHMILYKAVKLRSGWQSIFAVLSVAAMEKAGNKF
jgi:brefeldin A-inhibited guanine nucleotide-exchange protein